MADFEVTGTKNWTSNCGADFSFLDDFLREKANLKFVRQSTQEIMSNQVLDAYQHIQEASQTEADDFLSESRAEAERLNEEIYARENINPDDGVPAYVEEQLHEVPETLSETDAAEVEKRRQFYLSELYDAMRTEGLDSYLLDGTMAVVNSDSFSFHAYDAEMTRQEIAEAEAEMADTPKLDTDVAHHRDYAKGFEMDDAGNEVDDGYGIGD